MSKPHGSVAQRERADSQTVHGQGISISRRDTCDWTAGRKLFVIRLLVIARVGTSGWFRCNGGKQE